MIRQCPDFGTLRALDIDLVFRFSPLEERCRVPRWGFGCGIGRKTSGKKEKLMLSFAHTISSGLVLFSLTMLNLMTRLVSL
ncbi:hypothetical protein TWF225_010789 [Orbilia oligospora]|nr:hypothetical protein TWF751_011299 [Orbilia oligospora]KAF3170486.1 hypothetical protein TWF225_010789 [Orbilia oligospora]KAF3243155.1 hypothetical protein TWF217_011308 [Orbilia oligospora]